MPIYEAVGTGVEDMPTTQNYNVETKKDVLGRTVTKATSGNKTITITPVTFNPESDFAKFIDMATERQYQLSDLEKLFLFVKDYKLVNGAPVAWTQTGVVVPTEWALGNMDLQAGVEVNLVGEAVYGTLVNTAGTLTFTPEMEPPKPEDITYKTGDAARADFKMFYVVDTKSA